MSIRPSGYLKWKFWHNKEFVGGHIYGDKENAIRHLRIFEWMTYG